MAILSRNYLHIVLSMLDVYFFLIEIQIQFMGFTL